MHPPLICSAGPISLFVLQLGYLATEAPLLTWLPLLACAAAAAAGFMLREKALLWAATGGLAVFALTIWQVTRHGPALHAARYIHCGRDACCSRPPRH